MRKCLFCLGFFLFILSHYSFSQNIPNGVTAPASKTAVKTPVASKAAIFYQRVLTPNKPVTDSSLVNMSATVEDVSVTTQYTDGLGRPIETVVKQASPAKKDFIAPASFDGFGNVSYQYLPYAAQTGNSNDGKFKASPFKDDSAFYAGQFPNEDINYGISFFDASPLNRPTKQMAPGNSWAGSSKGVSYADRTNTDADSVRKWSINISGEDDLPSTTTTYTSGSLYVKEMTDERGYKTVSYTDEVGHTILTKSMTTSTAYPGHTDWLCTYYVYDEIGHLRMVFPPKAVSFLLANSWDVAGHTDIVNNLCYSYWYDNRGRAIEKHIPGKGKIYVAYDLYNRPVMTQDENLRTTNQWSFIKYDSQSRPDTTGLITVGSLTPAQVIANAASSNDYPTLTGTFTALSVQFYDNYSWVTGSIPSGTLITTNIINSTNFITSYNTAPYYAQQLTQSNRIRGFATGIKKLVLGTGTYLYTVNIYDERGRPIQAKQTNFTGGTDIATVQYDFSGKTLRSHLQHQKAGANTVNHTLLTKYAYDHTGRLTSLIKNIDGLGDKTTLQCTYNEFGQLAVKNLGQKESQNLTYNIRGWLDGINKNYVETATSTSSFFGEELFYDFGFSSVYYNGNISGVKWKSKGDNVPRAYGFGYDAVNRLIKADFTQQNNFASPWTNDKMDFSVSGLKYDVNGNITAMTQRGVNVSTPVTIDSLAYTYFTNSNQLQKIKDNIADFTNWGDFKDTSYTGNDYVYDENGNLTKDNNKHIHTAAGADGTTYNFLDKPDNITVNSKGSIAYTYDAGGALLQKTVTDTKTNIKTVITYIAGFVYQKTLPSSGNASTVPDSLQYVLHEEGRIRWSITQSNPSGYFAYDYFLKDHLRNIRSVITDEQDTAVYPAASLETAQLANEKLFYDNLDNGRTTKPSNYPADGSTNPNTWAQKLNGSSGGNKLGVAILLKVMAGDRITVNVTSWYSNSATPGTPASPLTDIVNALAATIPGVGGSKFASSQLSGALFTPGMTQFLYGRDFYSSSTLPKAFLNVGLFDEQLNPIMSLSSTDTYFQQVGASGSLTPLGFTDREITRSGYLYIFVSNETPNIDVYFDNLQVTHIKGPLLQEEGYYPFGLEMKAISSQAATKMQTRYKFNAGSELEDNFDVNYYETSFRQYDAQIGRFTGIDMLAESYAAITPYQFGGNNPITINDPTGAAMFFNADYGTRRFEAKMGGMASGDLWKMGSMDFVGGGFGDVFWGLGGGHGSGGGGGASATNDGFRFSGDAAVSSFFKAFLNAYHDDGDWSFTVGSKNGKIGFWEGYTFDPGSLGVDGVGVGTRFVSWNEHSSDNGSDPGSSLYRTPNGEQTHTLAEWTDHYKGRTWNEIASERPGRSYLGGAVFAKGGPYAEWRYLKLADGKILDMRHVLVVGMQYGTRSGVIIELGQFFFDKKSFNQEQDYYSNQIGSNFLKYLQENSVYYNTSISTQGFGNSQETSLAYYFSQFMQNK
jgi:RHS repeat-associated protein